MTGGLWERDKETEMVTHWRGSEQRDAKTEKQICREGIEGKLGRSRPGVPGLERQKNQEFKASLGHVVNLRPD